MKFYLKNGIFMFNIIYYHFSIKILSYMKVTPSEKMWNEKNTYYAINFIPNYKSFGGVERVLRFFKFIIFAVYEKTGKKIKNSVWYFWQCQFYDLVTPEWSGIDFLYPSDSGFSGWTLPECEKIKKHSKATNILPWMYHRPSSASFGLRMVHEILYAKE